MESPRPWLVQCSDHHWCHQLLWSTSGRTSPDHQTLGSSCRKHFRALHCSPAREVSRVLLRQLHVHTSCSSHPVPVHEVLARPRTLCSAPADGTVVLQRHLGCEGKREKVCILHMCRAITLRHNGSLSNYGIRAHLLQTRQPLQRLGQRTRRTHTLCSAQCSCYAQSARRRHERLVCCVAFHC